MHDSSIMAFRIEQFLETHVQRGVLLEEIPLESVDICACCADVLICRAVIRSDTSKQVRIGACRACGYVGYMDRPSRQWFESFYHDEWDEALRSDANPVRVFKKSPLVDRIHRFLDQDTTKRIFEIGVGFGQLLKQLSDLGYGELYGLEHSRHRAEAASVYTGARIIHAPFGTSDADAKIIPLGPMDLVYSKSVMEHAFSPSDFLASAGRLQKDGGILMIAVPNVTHEPTMNTLLFLPHLHAFTRASLWLLAQRNGYEPQDVLVDGKGIVLVAKKVSLIDTRPVPVDFMKEALKPIWDEKWKKELALEGSRSGPSIYWWTVDDAGRTGRITWFGKGGFALWTAKLLFSSKLLVPFWRLFFNVAKRRGAALIDYELSDGSPLEIRMKRLELLVK